MQKTYLYLMVCVIGAMSLASCSEDSISPDAGGDGDSTTEVPLAQVAKPKPNPWLAQEEYLVLEKLYRFITLSYLSLTLSGIECFSPAMPLHFGSKIGTSSLSTFFFR